MSGRDGELSLRQKGVVVEGWVCCFEGIRVEASVLWGHGRLTVCTFLEKQREAARGRTWVGQGAAQRAARWRSACFEGTETLILELWEMKG